jgi:carboxymethylenebutenolidase
MGWIELKAADGHLLRAWSATPAAPGEMPPRGAIVVLQEIFGANAHIRSVCDRYAAQGWMAVAPSLFDRATAKVPELGYGPQDIAQGRELKAKVSDEAALLDVQAAIDHAAAGGAKVAVVGFCWGGTLAWLAAARLQGLHAAVAYYGTNIAGSLHAGPQVPVLLHFGEQDPYVPPEHVRQIAAAFPQAGLHVYPAGHGFNCDARAAFHAPSAELAATRTERFLRNALSC